MATVTTGSVDAVDLPIRIRVVDVVQPDRPYADYRARREARDVNINIRQGGGVVTLLWIVGIIALGIIGYLFAAGHIKMSDINIFRADPQCSVEFLRDDPGKNRTTWLIGPC